jgi:hypothetical protein
MSILCTVTAYFPHERVFFMPLYAVRFSAATGERERLFIPAK